MASSVKRYELWALKLSSSEEVSDKEREMLQRAKARIVEAKNEMLDAKNAEALAALGASEDLKKAYGALAYLGSRHHLWEPPEEAKKPQQRREDARANRHIA